jgi:hypothetical protein
MQIKVPDFKEPGLTDFLARVLEERDRSRKDLVSSQTANHSILLQSPGGKVFEITVDDSGTIIRTLMAG